MVSHDNEFTTNTAEDDKYSYDGSGRRVKRINGSVTNIYVYNILGQIVAEYSNYRTSQTSETSYFTADHLGTPRIITNSQGEVISRHDYLPFGEEIKANVSGRTATHNYIEDADGVRQKFTQQERDDETGLDYFLARYYSAAQGRFLSVDPENAGAKIADPQSWNGYSYASNNPLRYVDPTGLDTVCRLNGEIVSCDTVINKIRQGDFQTVTFTSSTGASMTVRRADFYRPGPATPEKDGTVVVTTLFDNTGFMAAANSLAALVRLSVERGEPNIGFGGFGGGKDFEGGGSGGSWNCTSCPGFTDDPYNPDVVRGRQDARRQATAESTAEYEFY